MGAKRKSQWTNRGLGPSAKRCGTPLVLPCAQGMRIVMVGARVVPPHVVSGLMRMSPRRLVHGRQGHGKGARICNVWSVGDSLDHYGLVARKMYLLTLGVKGLVFRCCLGGYTP